jgi:hypothetical protein
VNPVRARAADDVVMALDESALRRKIDAALRYDELRNETEEDIRKNGLDAFRTERLHVVDGARTVEPSGIPYYEKRGEEQVNAGRYDEVLRYRPHFAQFVEEFSAVFRAGNRRPASSVA